MANAAEARVSQTLPNLRIAKAHGSYASVHIFRNARISHGVQPLCDTAYSSLAFVIAARQTLA
eukprot:5913105-Pleurochrysis_carterae.AAC.1